MDSIILSSMYMLALVNPVSKIFVLTTLSTENGLPELRKLSLKASLVGLAILMVFALGGKMILTNVFRVELYSFQIVGGLVLLLMGLRALTQGVFFESRSNATLTEMSIVPLASPMIAGPATITASVTFSVNYGLPVTMTAIVIAVGINLLFMLAAGWIGKALKRFNLMGALIRITGLIVATIAMQMILDGAAGWYFQTKGP